MEGVTLGFYKGYVKKLLKQFDVKLTKEVKEEIAACDTQRAVNRVKDRLINERLKQED